MTFSGHLPSGKVIKQSVEMIDFLPTLLELCGLDPLENIEGRSLPPLIQGKVRDWRPACLSEHDHSQDAYDELRRGHGCRVIVRTKEGGSSSSSWMGEFRMQMLRSITSLRIPMSRTI